MPSRVDIHECRKPSPLRLVRPNNILGTHGSFIPSILNKKSLCFTCSKRINRKRLEVITEEARSGQRGSIMHFNPADPIIESQARTFCSADCYVTCVLKEEQELEVYESIKQIRSMHNRGEPRYLSRKIFDNYV